MASGLGIGERENGQETGIREVGHERVHVLWMTTGLGCDGESVAMTSAQAPSWEELVSGSIPGLPEMVIHNPVLAFETGDEFVQAWYDAEEGELGPFVLVVEGSIANERINGDGHWSGFGVNPFDGQPITINEWVDRLAPKAEVVIAMGTCAAYGGIPAMKNNPTGAMGLPDFLGWNWRSRTGHPIICLPGCPAQPDNMTELLSRVGLYLAGNAPPPPLDDQLRPQWMFERTTREGCSRAGFTEQGRFATEYGNDPRCLVKLGCRGPVAKCNVSTRGWVNGVGGCPNVGGICIACTMPAFPDKYLPFMEPDPWGNAAANFQRFTYGPLFRYFRKRNLIHKFEREPRWRSDGDKLTSGYRAGRKGKYEEADRRW